MTLIVTFGHTAVRDVLEKQRAVNIRTLFGDDHPGGQRFIKNQKAQTEGGGHHLGKATGIEH